MKWMNIPPVWLGLAAVFAWGIARVQPFALRFGGPVLDLLGGLLVGAGIVLMLLAFIEMRKQHTTIVPHRDASRLVTTGIFRRSRNPIYLGDLLVLAGLCLRWDAPIALVMVGLLQATLTQLFIVPEEDRLRRKFRAEYARYCQNTRRWL
ncbi:isoprenylcysteine carboxylmethyltransferase family protein [Yoonia sp. I 8.24]|uniref:methyltransferase family protein n=1 Tax=Yoonia sp. I 8.24 TaxID=1537229 RepID=UPI001EE0AA86|nr:isoprenylcysteine carboxylmethyltransferase family protein [Yoonia sp. I 8.24]MCG3266541.1 isoprenylcysteine carboxylmethyltransferase family protein [Yoonia sp. I 8.24]